MNIRTRGVQAREKIGLTAGKASGKFNADGDRVRSKTVYHSWSELWRQLMQRRAGLTKRFRRGKKLVCWQPRWEKQTY